MPNSQDRNPNVGPVTAAEIAALNALLASAKTLGDVAAKAGEDAWVALRSMELREPALVES